MHAIAFPYGYLFFPPEPATDHGQMTSDKKTLRHGEGDFFQFLFHTLM